MDENSDSLKTLPKYNNCYFHKIDCQVSDLQTAKIRSIFKKIKFVRALEIKDYCRQDINLVTSIFKSQRKNITSVSMNDSSITKRFPKLKRFLLNAQAYWSWRTFITLQNLESLTMEFSNIFLFRFLGGPPKKTLKYLNWRFWSHLNNQKNLQNFDLQLYNRLDPEIYTFLQKLNTQTTFLESLHSFTLFLNHLEITISDSLEFKSVYKHITSFKIHEVPFATLEKLLAYIGQFQNLQYLSLLKTVKGRHEENAKVNLAFLQDFQRLHQLKTLDLALNLNLETCMITFLKHFTIPQQLTTLKLSFFETNWTVLIPNFHDENFKAFNKFETLELNQRFYQIWDDVKHLNSLSICFAEIDNNSLPSLYFIAPILRRLTSLSMLYYANWRNIDNGKKKALDFNYLWESIKHLKPTLKKLYVETFAITLRNLPQETQQDVLQLQELGLCGFILGDNHLWDLYRPLEERPVELARKSQLELERMVIDSDETFPIFLEDLLSAPKNIEVSINVDVRKLDAKKLVQTICSQIPRMFTKTNIQLNFSNVPELDPTSVEELKRLLKAHKMPRGLSTFVNPPEERDLPQLQGPPVGQLQEEQIQEIVQLQERAHDLRELVGNIPPQQEEEDNIGGARFSENGGSSDDSSSDDDSFDFEGMSFDDRFEDIDEDL